MFFPISRSESSSRTRRGCRVAVVRGAPCLVLGGPHQCPSRIRHLFLLHLVFPVSSLVARRLLPKNAAAVPILASSSFCFDPGHPNLDQGLGIELTPSHGSLAKEPLVFFKNRTHHPLRIPKFLFSSFKRGCWCQVLPCSFFFRPCSPSASWLAPARTEHRA